MARKAKLEICVDSLEAARCAAGLGADRIELCAALALGGLTPPPGMMARADRRAPIHAMIRPRPGDFCFDAEDHAAALADIARARDEGLAGVVIGASHADGALHLEQLAALRDAAGGMEVTLHRAFDLTPDPFAALEAAVDLGLTRILTSGQAPRAEGGLPLLADLARAAAGRIEIMAGSGLSAQNAARIWATGVDALHGSCVAARPSGANRIGIGPRPALPDAGEIRAIRAAMAQEEALA